MKLFLQPLAAGFRLAVAWRHAAYSQGLSKAHRLSRPVVSVGNLTMGGTGKTPLVALIAKLLLRHGWRPSILSRGYGRRSRDEVLLVETGLSRYADAWEVGDEPALLARLLPEVPIIVCADRFRGGRLADDASRLTYIFSTMASNTGNSSALLTSWFWMPPSISPTSGYFRRAANVNHLPPCGGRPRWSSREHSMVSRIRSRT